MKPTGFQAPPPPPPDNVPKEVQEALNLLFALADDITANLASPEALGEFLEEASDLLSTLTYHGVQESFAERARLLLTACRTVSLTHISREWSSSFRTGVEALALCWNPTQSDTN